MINDFDITIGNPQYKVLFIILPLIFMLHFYFLNHAKRRALKFGNFSAMKRVETNTRISKNLTTLFFSIFLSFILILSILDITLWYESDVTDSNYYILLDSGASMNARDLYPDRYTIAKKVSEDVANGLINSRIGFLSFSGKMSRNVHPTIDKSIVLNAIHDSQIENSGTDMGLALLSSGEILNGLEKAGTIILVSDGHATVGVSLNDAIISLKEKHIKVIAIGVGTEAGGAFLDIPDIESVVSKLDKDNLVFVSKETNGVYIQISDEDYDVGMLIDKIISEKKRGMVAHNITNLLLLSSLTLLLFSWTLENTRFRIFP